MVKPGLRAGLCNDQLKTSTLANTFAFSSVVDLSFSKHTRLSLKLSCACKEENQEETQMHPCRRTEKASYSDL